MKVPEDGVHPGRRCRGEAAGFPTKVCTPVVSGHVNCESGCRLHARVPGYKYDQVGIDLIVDPVLVDQPAIDLMEDQVVSLRKRPVPTGFKQILEIIPDVYSCSVLF